MFIFRIIIAILKLFNPKYYVTRRMIDPKEQEQDDARKLLKVIRNHKEDDDEK